MCVIKPVVLTLWYAINMVLLDKAKLSDIAPIFNLILECSACNYFNGIYLEYPYQAGMALQLFSVWLLGKIRLPPGVWQKATLYVIRHENTFLGFALLRYTEPSGSSQEIYMCAIEAKYRGKGLGRLMIQSVLEELEDNTIVEADCLPQSVHMKYLLRRLGFESINSLKNSKLNNAAKFRLSCGSGNQANFKAYPHSYEKRLNSLLYE